MVRKPERHLITACLATLVAVGLAACTDDAPAAGGDAITFAAPEAAETRAAVDGGSLTEGSFTVWGGKTADEFDGETVTGSGGVWTYTGTRYWTKGAEYNFYAVYPASVKEQVKVDYDNGTIAVDDFDCSATGDAAVDLMTASATNIVYNEGDTPQSVAFRFSHLLARVTVSVRTGQGVTASGISATLSGLATTGDYNGTWTPNDTSTKDFETTHTAEIKENTSQELFDDLLIIPQSLANATLTIKLTRESGSTSENISQTFNLDGSLARWSAGSHYRYTLTVEPDAITFSNFTVDEWEETHTGGDINIGENTNNN